jgi:hypothetical protein
MDPAVDPDHPGLVGSMREAGEREGHAGQPDPGGL